MTILVARPDHSEATRRGADNAIHTQEKRAWAIFSYRDKYEGLIATSTDREAIARHVMQNAHLAALRSVAYLALGVFALWNSSRLIRGALADSPSSRKSS